jgi:hypothetical protein
MLPMRSRRRLLPLATLAVGLLHAGCVDPDGSFNDFGARYNADNPPIMSSCGGDDAGVCHVPAAGAADGDYLFLLSPKISPKKPSAFLVHVTSTAMGDGLDLMFNAQPLKASDRKTPTGTASDAGPYHVGKDGCYVAVLPDVTTPADADPLGLGPVEALPTLTGRVCTPIGFFCGTVTGKILKPTPLSLDGSTFTLSLITDPNNYPPAYIDCDKNLADPPM